MTTGERFVQFLEHVTNDRSTEFAWINLPPSCIIFIPSMAELVEDLCAPRSILSHKGDNDRLFRAMYDMVPI